MRYFVYGAGAVGGVIGGRLAEAGCDVTLIARGDHLAAVTSSGLEIRMPGRTATIKVTCAGSTAEAGVTDGDVVVMAMKSQDTVAALDALAAVAPRAAVICAQNGVNNEREALRRFADVYATCVMLPATHLEPGVVEQVSPIPGILDTGRYPTGTDAVTDAVTADLSRAGFSSRADPAVMRQKYRKLLMNLGNAIEAACGAPARESDLYRRARSEGEAVLRAADIDVASAEEDRARRADLLTVQPPVGLRRAGGSSWQSLAKGSGSIEADYLNGEIVLLGRLHGVATPVNAALQQIANRMAREKRSPGSLAVEDLAAQIG